MSNKAIIKTPKKQSDLKLVRISRNVGRKLSGFINEQRQKSYVEINAGRFIDQSILEKIQRESK